MNYKIFDTDLIEINDNLDLQICRIGDGAHIAIIIDNFLKNPEYLKEITQSHPFDLNYKNNSSSPGFSSPTALKYYKIKKTATYLAKNYFNLTHVDDNYSLESIYVQFNLLKGGCPCKYSSIAPHVDPAFLAFQIYLNEPDDCNGGTSFYKNKEANTDVDAYYIDKNHKQKEEYFKLKKYRNKLESIDHNTILDCRLIDFKDWEEYFRIEMKYNRFVIYPSYAFHAPYIEKEWFRDTYRVSLVGFLT
jgi:hypothetical protein